jgi:hypothetical protein
MVSALLGGTRKVNNIMTEEVLQAKQRMRSMSGCSVSD